MQRKRRIGTRFLLFLPPRRPPVSIRIPPCSNALARTSGTAAAVGKFWDRENFHKLKDGFFAKVRKDCRGAERAEMAQPDTATTAIHYSLVLRQDLYRLSPLSPSSPSSSFVPANNVSTPFPPFLFHFAEGAAVLRLPPHLHRNHAERNAILRCCCVPFHQLATAILFYPRVLFLRTRVIREFRDAAV